MDSAGAGVDPLRLGLGEHRRALRLGRMRVGGVKGRGRGRGGRGSADVDEGEFGYLLVYA